MAFANQYYQILASSPQLLFRFYKEGSTLRRLDHRGEMISVTGMDAIKEKLLSVDYSEYRAEIKTVDGQKSMNGCLTVLVAGYLTGKDDGKKKFAQFFMLAPQDKGYNVLNDIFRLLAPEQAQDAAMRLLVK
ncbi:hypothetical protein ZIOFF_035662 [Zingiber officinale]|uniref:NTF2 domain-containing protein n=1 Tax=Zingiber officinale TaxID=94328 RepID=A0A8J5L793_ZINOF|nr:hypothetical protein ZIOFF_035662 [Zingiber officinale]